MFATQTRAAGVFFLHAFWKKKQVFVIFCVFCKYFVNMGQYWVTDMILWKGGPSTGPGGGSVGVGKRTGLGWGGVNTYIYIYIFFLYIALHSTSYLKFSRVMNKLWWSDVQMHFCSDAEQLFGEKGMSSTAENVLKFQPCGGLKWSILHIPHIFYIPHVYVWHCI